MRLCGTDPFTSESASIPGAQNFITLNYDGDGNVVFTGGGVGPGPMAANAQVYIPQNLGGGLDHSDAYIYYLKSATRTPVALLSRQDDQRMDPYGGLMVIAPVNIGPGEFIFDPSDVPAGYASSNWFTTPAPGLPPP